MAEALSALGYQSFVVDYRLRPYTQQEGALDLARAVRFVRSHAVEYGIDPQDIAVMGFSAGGILSGEMLLNFDGDTSPTALDPTYQPDDLDTVSADAAACGMIYSFYGRLSFGTTDVELLRSGNLPPTFYCYGTRDPFLRPVPGKCGRGGRSRRFRGALTTGQDAPRIRGQRRLDSNLRPVVVNSICK